MIPRRATSAARRAPSSATTPVRIDDLRASLAARPYFLPAALELGVALTEAGQYKEAEPWLLQAQRQPDLDAQASFFLGIAQLRLERFSDAEQSFARARARDPSLDLAVEYYAGVIAYRRHDLASAETHFTAVQRANPDSAMAREAGQFLAFMSRTQRAAYSAFGTVGLEYDTNVTLGPSTTVPSAISREADGRVVLNAGGTYIPWSLGRCQPRAQLRVLPEPPLPPAGLQPAGPPAGGAAHVRLRPRLRRSPRPLRLLPAGDRQLPAGSHRIPLDRPARGGIGRTEVYLRMQWRHYYQQSLVRRPRTASTTIAGVRQIIELGSPDRELWFGYQLGFNSPDDRGSDAYQYNSQQVRGGTALAVAVFYCCGSWISATSTRPMTIQRDHQPSARTPDATTTTAVIVSFERPLSEINEHLFVDASWYGTLQRLQQHCL